MCLAVYRGAGHDFDACDLAEAVFQDEIGRAMAELRQCVCLKFLAFQRGLSRSLVCVHSVLRTELPSRRPPGSIIGAR